MLQKGLIPILFNDPTPKEYKDYYTYVYSQGGTINSSELSKKLVSFYKSQGRWNDIKLLWSAVGGTLVQSGTNPLQVSKAYSADSNRNDLAQATSLNQPYGVGHIQGLPMGLYNPNGVVRYMTHPGIAFAANEAWSVSININNKFQFHDGTNERSSGQWVQQAT